MMKDTVQLEEIGHPMHKPRSRFVLAVASLPLLLVLLLPSGAWATAREKVIYSFTGGSDGSSPIGILTLDKKGNLYGAASRGGSSQNGVVFELTPGPGGQWTETVLYTFSGTDGALPFGGVIFDKAGNLYGVTRGGGNNACFSGCGTVFELTPGANGQWTETVLYAFTGGSDGGAPDTKLIFDEAGNLYGTTNGGGDASCGCGTVFELTPGLSGLWTETVLHAFKGGTDGASPVFAGLTFVGDNLYGTTAVGGQYGIGTIFELAPAKDGAWRETILHAFKGGSDGYAPAAGLALFEGKLYGTTYAGGALSCGSVNGCGTVFQLKQNARGKWAKTVIHKFHGSDGIETLATPVLDKAGHLYATTFEGGSGPCSVCGTAFELTPTANGPWHETVLHDFGSRINDAGTPVGGLIINKAGHFFGTTEGGGTNGVGAVYEITP